MKKNLSISLLAFLFILPSAAVFSAPQPVPDILLGNGITALGHQTESTIHNIHLALNKFEGTLLQPGELFSFNKIVGNRTAENGFKSSPVIFNGKRVDMEGGGVCQVSSTLYYAALQAGMEIVERHKHSSPVSYIHLGLDATIVWGLKDLTFKNSLNQRVMIRGEVFGDELNIAIYGEKEPEYRYETISEINEIPPPETDRDLLPALEALVYRIKKKNGANSEREFLYRDYYPPRYISNEY